MAADTLKILEFTELISLVGAYVASPLGKVQLVAVGPCTDIDIITGRQQRAAEAREYLRSHSGAPGEGKSGDSPARTLPLNFSAFTDPTHLIQKAAIEGSVLELPEIAELLSFAERASDIKRAITAGAQRFPRLAEEAARIAEFHSLLRDLGGRILPSGELDDHASNELNRIRREMERQRAFILSSLKAFLRNQAEETPEQDEIITVRGERFVVPIRSAKKSRIQGVVHGASSTGQTVYVEPLETIELNNDLVRLREQEHRETVRIMAEMTQRLRERAPELAEAALRIGILELAFGLGRFAVDYDCIIPAIGTRDGPARLVLKAARHPLLEAMLRRKKAGVVPLSITLNDKNRVLLISGPNTGGKTVALKTVGLLALMALSGLPVPAAEAEFPLFERVLADIGDYQSIQESLSTFSAHLINISSMMELANRDTLILLDELGSATDPDEAGALGVAVVDRFRSAGAFTIASTHHMLLKAYASNTPGVLSAHMGFNEQSLEPTYRLEIGMPGKSSGLAMARRLGLPQDVLDRATESLSGAHREVEMFLSRLKEREAAAAELALLLEAKIASLDARERQWNSDLRRREEQRTAEWEKQLDQLRRSFEERLEEKLRQIAVRAPSPSRRQADPGRESARIGSQVREHAKDELRQAVVSHLGEFGEAANAQSMPAAANEVAKDAMVGDRVRLKDFSQPGIVRRRDGESLEVEIGRLRTKVSLSDVAEVLAAVASGSPAFVSGSGSVAKPNASSFNVRMERPSAGTRSEINVIGENAEDALDRVDKFLDNAFLAQLPSVRVVHGSGKGILRRALAEMLSTHPHVEKFALAPQNEGGAGATIVELKA